MFGWIKRLFGKKPTTGEKFNPPPARFGGSSPSPYILPPSYPGFRTKEQNEAARRSAPAVRSRHFYDPGRPVDSSDDMIRMAIMTNLASDHSAHRGCDEHVKPADTLSSCSSSSDSSCSSYSSD